ncbi:glycosyltransferase family A protein [Paenibacillus rhizophilus]|uniref:Glycosyltransferase family 2 protein n=1 Tax=Paenibacillus rhizophilus TaxID=1850366 RepID=A0A3N9P2H6_9BACL|nr:glycosyltransferase family A protein [Paenibacillus rhizophilus]RQW10378.1 glycosyltransferase family 2 protein [Paenibacillus rhizophilus]
MMAQLIWIGAVYASAVMCVHALKFREKMQAARETGKWLHYILIARNHESVVEGIIRAMTLQSFLTGKRLRVTFMDDGSSDGTLRIVSGLRDGGCSLDVRMSRDEDGPLQEERKAQPPWGDKDTVIDLRLPEHPIPLPFMQAVGSRGFQSKRGRM